MLGGRRWLVGIRDGDGLGVGAFLWRREKAFGLRQTQSFDPPGRTIDGTGAKS